MQEPPHTNGSVKEASDKVVAGQSECRGTTGPCEDKVKLIPGPVGRWRRGECEVKCDKVNKFR